MAEKSLGAITILRDIQKHWLWKYKPFSKGQAWIDMLLLANHKTEKVPFENRIEIVERGQFITSQVKLTMRWGWSRQQVRTFLALLENPNPDAPMVKCQNLTNRATKLTIINYSDLQKLPTKSITNSQPTPNQLLYINKNDKNEKNEKNIYISNQIPPPLEAVNAYCQERNRGVDPNKWYNHYQAKGWMIGKNKMKDWRAAVRTWEKEYKDPAEVYFKGKELK